MNENFTKGPWDYNKGDFSIYQVESGKPLERNEANASLIACAPDLYAAVRDLLNEFVGEDPEVADESGVVTASFELLAKATGGRPPDA